jgi:hypothetical protein
MLPLLFVLATVAAARGTWSPCGLSMLSTLNPVSERARGHRFWATSCWYVAGAVVGGAVLGGGCAVLAWGFGRLDPAASLGWSLALVGAAAAVLSDVRLGGWSLPLHPRQVDERWVDRYRRWLYAAGYGVQIGSGFATYIMTAGVYLVALLAVLTGSPAQAFAGCVVFGLVRGMSVLVAAAARTPDALRTVIGRIDAWEAASAVLAAAGCAAVVVVAAFQLAGTPGAVGVGAACTAALGYSTRYAAARAV